MKSPWITVQKSPWLIPVRKHITVLHGCPYGERYSCIRMLLFQLANPVSNCSLLLVTST